MSDLTAFFLAALPRIVFLFGFALLFALVEIEIEGIDVRRTNVRIGASISHRKDLLAGYGVERRRSST
ncbi:MAG: hypothetical protein ABSF35_01560 [Polyangia bacterium]|jgi:hypothetical protein